MPGGQKRRRIDDEITVVDYYFCSEGYRHVRPYVFNFQTHAKARWYGRSILDVFTSEFASHPKAYYATAIEQGRITVNGETVPVSYVLKGGDSLSHMTHRHEPPVAGTNFADLEIVADTDDLLVVNKPSTVPMHPCGAYRFNSMAEILTRRFADFDAARTSHPLHIVHRLDRLTSGVALFGKSPAVARRFGEDLVAGHTSKTYLARVIGDFGTEFPSAWNRPAVALESDEKALGWAVSSSSGGSAGEVRVQQPIGCVSQKDGVYECSYASDPARSRGEGKDAKDATTLFRRLSFNGRTSLVEARPVHGRTHQIRLHLLYLGHPIANDPCYGGRLNYGVKGIADESNEVGQGPHSTRHRTAADEAAKETVVEDYAAEAQPPRGETAATAAAVPGEGMAGGAGGEALPKDEWFSRPRGAAETLGDFMSRTCLFCHGRAVGSEVAQHCGGIWLHALCYQRVDPATPHHDWRFSTRPPPWAEEGFVEVAAEDLFSGSNPSTFNEDGLIQYEDKPIPSG